jgi:hypothetical protein
MQGGQGVILLCRIGLHSVNSSAPSAQIFHPAAGFGGRKMRVKYLANFSYQPDLAAQVGAFPSG